MRFFKSYLRRARSFVQELYLRAFSDRRLASYLADLFESNLHALQAEGLRFYVKDRIVTIHGTLYRDIDREMVIKHASRVVGLKAVVDRLNVVDDVYKEDLNARIVLLLNDKYEPKRLLPA